LSHITPLSEVQISPERQRKEFAPEAIAELADSISALGLLQPPLAKRLPEGGNSLLAGERRFRAISLLAAQGERIRFGDSLLPLGTIPLTLISDLSPIDAFRAELHENIIRVDLSWQERTAAFARLHELEQASGKSYREALIATKETIDGPITNTKWVATKETHQLVVLGKHLDDPDVAKAKTAQEAVKIVERKLRKKQDSAAPEAAAPGIIVGDALTELAKLPAASFHCVVSDPPYGIDISQLSYQNSSEQLYDDTYATWSVLLPAVVGELSRVLRPDADGYLFCDFTRFTELAAILTSHGFEVYPKPFIWDRSPDGRLTTAEKWPRRCYECILYFRRGKSPLYEVRGDVLRYPADRSSGNYHGAKKPVELYLDLLQRSTRPGDHVLDPFGGSGPILRAARRHNVSAIMIEGDPAYAGLASRLFQEELTK
jgi:ParB/RepB/Spo0J family partition protein